MCFGGFSPVGAATGGLAGPASVISHPNINNLIGGGQFTDAVKKKASSDTDAQAKSTATLLTPPQQQQAKTTAEQPGKNPLELDTAKTIQ